MFTFRKFQQQEVLFAVTLIDALVSSVASDTMITMYDQISEPHLGEYLSRPLCSTDFRVVN
jgi:hypothetical protein